MLATTAVFHQPGQPFTIEHWPIPDLLPGETLVRIRLATICASDIHTVSGRRATRAPIVLGHEAVGEVVISPHHAPGQRMLWSILRTCGACEFCYRKVPSSCPNLLKFGHEPKRLSGAFADYAILPPGALILPAPVALPDEALAPAICAGATAAAVLEAVDTAHSKFWIFGAGLLGLYAIAMAAALGHTVIAFDPDSHRRTLALQFGAQQALAAPTATLDSPDTVLELAGSPDAIEASLGALSPGGLLLLAGSVFPSRPIAFAAETIVRRRLRIGGIYNYAPHNLQQAIGFLEKTSLPFASLVSACFPLDQINQAFAAARNPNHLRVAIKPY
jgi:putative phosphonate catabolism associated alcohol dehydrogenase